MIWSTKSILSNQSIIAVTYAISETQMPMCLHLSSKVGTCQVAWLIFLLSHSYCVHSCKKLTYDLSYLSDDEARIYSWFFFVLVTMKTAVRDTSYTNYYLVEHFNEGKDRKKYLLSHTETLTWKCKGNLYF